MKNTLFIGLGHMGMSLVKGIINNKEYENNIYGFNNIPVQAPNNLQMLSSLNEIELNQIEVIVIGVRPADIDLLAQELNALNLKNITLVSMVNALEIKTIYEKFNKIENICAVRIMPNMNALYQQSTTAICVDSKIELQTYTYIKKMFENCGIVEKIDEKDFNTYTAIASCLPAYVFTFFKGILDFAVENNLEIQQAKRIIHNSILGSVNNVINSNSDLQNMIDSVCTPGGSTIAGETILIEENFIEIIKKCLKAAQQKS